MRRRDILIGVASCGVCLLAGCASRGAGPQGGPVDSIPPRVLACVPADGATNVQSQEIQIRFDEYVKLDRASEKVRISPPSQSQPVIKAIGKKVSVTLSDSLLPNTTYTIYFGDAIQDNNEKNAVRDYTLSFSTGETIDSLLLTGRAMFAETQKPASGVIVGIHPATAEDSVVSKQPFLRIARTDTSGYFVIRHIHEGSYRVYALSDSNRNYTYERNEPIAFVEEPVIVSDSGLVLQLFNCLIKRDSTLQQKDSVATDSLLRDSLPADTLAKDTTSAPKAKKDSTATASIRVVVEPAETNVFVQLLGSKDELFATEAVRTSGDVLFEHLKAGTYMLRAFVDLNGDSIWTTGDYYEKRQPEPMYYFPKRLKIRENWDFEETFRWRDESYRPK